MIQLLLCFFLGQTLAQVNDHWAILVAGSKSFYNYRHQADVCHAYHVLLDQGISSDHIIVMAYDDIAFDDENPFPGTLYNKQGGVDVYGGCVIDFFGDDVNKNNFDAVMKGDLTSLNLTNEKSTGRVLETDADTKLFLYFSDHGAPGHVMFPNDLMYADELNDTIQFMYDNQMYQEFVIFLEACESGSMF
jgi:legumain